MVRQNKYPKFWAAVYFISVAVFTRYSIRFYTEQGKHLETVIRAYK